jgi:GT2 family glycosyltransferase
MINFNYNNDDERIIDCFSKTRLTNEVCYSIRAVVGEETNRVPLLLRENEINFEINND